MSSRTGEVLSREMRRLRWSLLNVFCLIILLVLAVAYVLPRSYVSNSTLAWRSSAAGERLAVQTKLRSLAAQLGNGTLTLLDRGDQVALSWESGSAAVPGAALKEILDTITADARAAVLSGLDANIKALDSEVELARAAYESADQQLQNALAAVPEGGGVAAGAKLGQLQAEEETLALKIREDRAREQRFVERIGELERQVAASLPDLTKTRELGQALKRVEAELLPAVLAQADAETAFDLTIVDPESASEEQLQSAREAQALLQKKTLAVEAIQLRVDDLTRQLSDAQAQLADDRSKRAGLEARREAVREDLAGLREELATNAKRQRELARLIDAAREQFAQLERDNIVIRDLRLVFERARQEFRDAQAEAGRYAEEAARQRVQPALSFSVRVPPTTPVRARGLESGQYLLIALAAGFAVSLLYLLFVGLAGASGKSLARLAEELHTAALVELPVWQDATANKDGAVRVFVAVLLVILTLAACAMFIRFS